MVSFTLLALLFNLINSNNVDNTKLLTCDDKENKIVMNGKKDQYGVLTGSTKIEFNINKRNVRKIVFTLEPEDKDTKLIINQHLRDIPVRECTYINYEYDCKIFYRPVHHKTFRLNTIRIATISLGAANKEYPGVKIRNIRCISDDEDSEEGSDGSNGGNGGKKRDAPKVRGPKSNGEHYFYVERPKAPKANNPYNPYEAYNPYTPRYRPVKPTTEAPKKYYPYTPYVPKPYKPVVTKKTTQAPKSKPYIVYEPYQPRDYTPYRPVKKATTSKPYTPYKPYTPHTPQRQVEKVTPPKTYTTPQRPQEPKKQEPKREEPKRPVKKVTPPEPKRPQKPVEKVTPPKTYTPPQEPKRPVKKVSSGAPVVDYRIQPTATIDFGCNSHTASINIDKKGKGIIYFRPNGKNYQYYITITGKSSIKIERGYGLSDVHCTNYAPCIVSIPYSAYNSYGVKRIPVIITVKESQYPYGVPITVGSVQCSTVTKRRVRTTL